MAKPVTVRTATSRRAAADAVKRKQRGKRTVLKPELIAYAVKWRIIDIINLLGSARCSGLTVRAPAADTVVLGRSLEQRLSLLRRGSTWTQCTIVNAELGRRAVARTEPLRHATSPGI